MFVRAINIQNYRGIEKLQMDFSEGVNVIIGNNGAGKTSLLNAIAVIINQPMQMIRDSNSPINIIDDVRVTTAVIGGAVTQPIPHYPVNITGSVIFNNKEYECDREVLDAASGYGSKHTALMDFFRENFGDPSIAFPLLCFLNAGRGQIIQKKKAYISLNGEAVKRIEGYNKAFSSEINIDDIQDWCFKMDFTEFQDKKPVKEYMEFQAIVSRFFSLIDESSPAIKVYYSGKKESIVLNDGSEEKPLYQLSAGYQAVLCTIIELAYRAVILNPSMENVSENITGIVLIDEIEMHLHPAWQWRILEALRGTFPKVQFIIATHSPIILSSASNASVFLMNSPNEVISVGDAYGYSINDVLSLLQASEYQPAKISDYYRRAEEIFDQGDDEKLDELLQKAETELKDNPGVLKNFLEFIEVNRWAEEA